MRSSTLRRAVLRACGVLLGAGLALFASLAVAMAPAAAGPATIKVLTCPSGGTQSGSTAGAPGKTQAVGSFMVSCSGQGGPLVTIAVIGSTCGTGAAGGRCDLRFEMSSDTATILGASVLQSVKGTGPGTAPSTHFRYMTAIWTLTVQVPGQAPATVQLTVAADSGVGLTGVSAAVEDTTNIADGAARGQASD